MGRPRWAAAREEAGCGKVQVGPAGPTGLRGKKEKWEGRGGVMWASLKAKGGERVLRIFAWEI